MAFILCQHGNRGHPLSNIPRLKLISEILAYPSNRSSCWDRYSGNPDGQRILVKLWRELMIMIVVWDWCAISDRLMNLTCRWRAAWFLIFLTTWTLESLMGDTMKHRAAVVAEGRRQVRENLPFVLLAHLGTRNRGPGKPGPSFVVWSCVAEKSRRMVAVYRSIPQRGSSSEKKY